MIEVISFGLPVVAAASDGEEFLIGHIYREGDQLRGELEAKYAGNAVAARLMRGAIEKTTLDRFQPVPTAKGDA